MFSFLFNMYICDEYEAKFSLAWSNATPEISIQSHLGFLSASWFQFMQAVTAQNILICSGCSKTYNREKRKPKQGQKNYCDECGTAAAKRNWYHSDKNKVKE